MSTKYKGHSFSTIKCARYAVVTIAGNYVTGVFNTRPPSPKLYSVWDVDTFFENQGDSNLLSDVLIQKLLNLLLSLGIHKLSTKMSLHNR